MNIDEKQFEGMNQPCIVLITEKEKEILCYHEDDLLFDRVYVYAYVYVVVVVCVRVNVCVYECI